MDICNCHKDLEKYLCDVPDQWREGIVKALCYVFDDKCEDDECEGVKDCETTTFLSDFTVEGNEVSISYTNERNTRTLSFDVVELIDNALDIVDPKCLASIEDWAEMTYVERLQLLLDAQCECCTTTTTSTTTSTSTTTTSTSTSTTTSTSTSSTTTTSSSTTTTTSHPIADFIARNISSDGRLNDVTPVFYTTVLGAYPLALGEELIGKHSGFSGVISGNVTVVTSPSYLRLYRDGIFVACRLCTVSDIYAFPSNTFLNTEEIKVTLTSTPPDEPSAFCI